jgi:hypothetical protein
VVAKNPDKKYLRLLVDGGGIKFNYKRLFWIPVYLQDG